MRNELLLSYALEGISCRVNTDYSILSDQD